MSILTRRLGTANSLRTSIRVVKKNLARARGMVDPVKIFLSLSLIIMQILVAVAYVIPYGHR